jgi:hypothetical protein
MEEPRKNNDTRYHETRRQSAPSKLAQSRPMEDTALASINHGKEIGERRKAT